MQWHAYEYSIPTVVADHAMLRASGARFDCGSAVLSALSVDIVRNNLENRLYEFFMNSMPVVVRDMPDASAMYCRIGLVFPERAEDRAVPMVICRGVPLVLLPATAPAMSTALRDQLAYAVQLALSDAFEELLVNDDASKSGDGRTGISATNDDDVSVELLSMGTWSGAFDDVVALYKERGASGALAEYGARNDVWSSGKAFEPVRVAVRIGSEYGFVDHNPLDDTRVASQRLRLPVMRPSAWG